MKTRYLFIAILVVATSPIYLENPVYAQKQASDSSPSVSAHQHMDTRQHVGTSQAEPSAQPAQPPCSEKPWYCGVSEEERHRAFELFEEGNRLFDASLFLPASKKYSEALDHWDHPGIRYNLMLAYVGLDMPIEAFRSAQKALQYGELGLRPEEYHRARDYLKILSGRVTELEIVCDEPGASVSLDGKILFEGPGRARHLLLPGQHEVVAKKRNYLTTNAPLLLFAKKPTTVELDMLRNDELVFIERRWEVWKPWAVVGAGAGLGLIGGAFHWRASVSNQRYSEVFDEECPAPNGCDPEDYSPALRSLEFRSTWYRRTSYSFYAAGGAAVATGLVLVYLNVPKRRENPRIDKLVHISVTPTLTPSSGGLALDMTF